MRKKALITGGAGGIGEAICRKMAEEGYFVFIGYSASEDKANRLAAEIDGEAIKIDVTKYDEIQAAAEKIGYAEVLVNNAGISEIELFTRISAENSRKIMETNLIGAMNCSRIFLSEMISEKRGCIINISSMWGQVGASCEVDYSASKAGMIGFTKALAKEVAPSGL